MNAANEIAVQAFLDHQISFMDIAKINAKTIEKISPYTIQNIDDVLEIDTQAREIAKTLIGK